MFTCPGSLDLVHAHYAAYNSSVLSISAILVCLVLHATMQLIIIFVCVYECMLECLYVYVCMYEDVLSSV